MKGTVKKFMDDRGFGFIEPEDDGGDIFVHVSQCPGSNPLKRGTPVQFTVEADDSGLRRRAFGVSVDTTDFSQE